MTNPPVTEEAVRVARALIIAEFSESGGEAIANGAQKGGWPMWQKALSQARAAIAALTKSPPVVSEGWQPIETAPRDGTRILLCYPTRAGLETGEGRWNEEQGRFTSRNGFLDLHEATNWQPLPAPPLAMSVKSEATQGGVE